MDLNTLAHNHRADVAAPEEDAEAEDAGEAEADQSAPSGPAGPDLIVFLAGFAALIVWSKRSK